MDRRRFIEMTGGTVLASGAIAYLLSDKENLVRSDLQAAESPNTNILADEREILTLASLAPSGHNTQPWFVKYLAPFHWIIGNDKSKWLPAVDPTQRETMLSIGAFLQNLEFAADSFGYKCDWTLLAETNQDENVMKVKLTAQASKNPFDTEQIKNRRTVRSGFQKDVLRKEDADFLINSDKDFIQYLPNNIRESQFIDEQTVEANRLQSDRDAAQKELADWIRFSSKDAAKYRDGLTTAGMEIEGVSGFIVRNFYDRADVMKANFRQTSVDKVKTQVSESAGWILLTSKDNEVETLLETGRRMQRLFLKVREKNIAIHPMTQILEEPATRETLNQSIGISENVQFILRVGYLKNYPPHLFRCAVRLNGFCGLKNK